MESVSNSTTRTNFSNSFFNAYGPFHVGVWFNVFFWISATSIIISFYLFICLTLYVVRKFFTQRRIRKNFFELTTFIRSSEFNGTQEKKLRKVNQSQCQNPKTSRSKQNDFHKPKTSKWKAKAVHILLLVTLGLNLMRGVVELLLFFKGGYSDNICELLTALMIGFTGFAMHGCGVFLWMRQHIFYSNLLIKHLKPKGRKYISLITYLEIVVTLIVNVSIHLWWRNYTTSDGLCRPVVGSHKIPPFVAFGLVAFSTVTVQVSLTYLFAYPLITHKKQVKKLAKATETSRSTSQFLECIKRVLIGATIGITTDIVGTLVSILLPEDFPIFILSVIYELDISLNIVCIFYTYRYWKNIVFPWKRKLFKRKTTP